MILVRLAAFSDISLTDRDRINAARTAYRNRQAKILLPDFSEYDRSRLKINYFFDD